MYLTHASLHHHDAGCVSRVTLALERARHVDARPVTAHVVGDRTLVDVWQNILFDVVWFTFGKIFNRYVNHSINLK